MTKVQEDESIVDLVQAALGGHDETFRPRAFFDRRLDCIRVIAQDCSILEERVNDKITVLLDNHAGPTDNPFVGFTIKGAGHFCQSMGWPVDAPIAMTDFMDAVLKVFPEKGVKEFVNIVARPLVKDKHIERIEVPMAA